MARFSLKPDYEEVYKRYEAFWNCSMIDRPLVTMSWAKPTAGGDGRIRPRPAASAAVDYEAQWLDIERRADAIVADLQARVFFADSLPIAWPNMGPEIFSAWCGCPYRFGEHTTWTEPCIHDWDTDADKGRLDMNHPLLQKTIEFTDALLERGRGNFIVGLTDFHPGGDHLAALRDPEQLAIDLIDNPDAVKARLRDSYPEYRRVFTLFYDRLREAGMPSTTWCPLVYEGSSYIPSNDFSAMISTAMFEEFFLDGIVEECRFFEKSIYHLDGPNALRHLDALLAIPELDALQWVPGAGNEQLERWIPVYQRAQAAGKAIQVLNVDLSNLPLLFEHLKPEGVWISGVAGVHDEQTAGEVLRRLERWR